MACYTDTFFIFFQYITIKRIRHPYFRFPFRFTLCVERELKYLFSLISSSFGAVSIGW
jgi:hypothetical protein